MTSTDLAQTQTITKTISPAQHAVLDYGVAAAFFAFGFSVLSRHRSAAALAFVNGAMIVGMSMLTDYPGGVFRTLSFRAHRTGDIAQAALARLGPILFGFGSDPEARYFYGQAASEAGVIAATATHNSPLSHRILSTPQAGIVPPPVAARAVTSAGFNVGHGRWLGGVSIGACVLGI